MRIVLPVYLKNLGAIVAGTICFSTSFGMNIVLFPLTLESRGFSTTLIGLNSTLDIGAGLMIAPFLPMLVRRFGADTVFCWAATARILFQFLLPYTNGYLDWVFCKFIMSMGGFAFFIILQTWLMEMVPDNKKGFALGVFTTTFSIGTALGPIILGYTGTVGYTPFFVSTIIFSAVLFPTFSIRDVMPVINKEPKSHVLQVIRLSPTPMLAEMVREFVFASLVTFLVLYGLYNGLVVREAALLVTAFMMGSIFLDALVGFIADRTNRKAVTQICMLITLMCCMALPFLIDDGRIVWGVLFLWCGALGGIYSSSLALLGQRFKGPDLMSANSAFTIVGSIAGMIGAFTTGLAMDIWKPHGMVYAMTAVCFIYVGFAVLRQLHLGKVAREIADFHSRHRWRLSR